MEKICRRGLRIRYGIINKDVADSVRRFVKWLRNNYKFPIRIPIYLSTKPMVKAIDGDLCYSTFFEPFKKDVEPYIRVATGEYTQDKKELGKDNALAAPLSSIAFQLQYYFSWCQNEPISEKQARRRGRAVMRKYSSTVDHP
jgi:hypothetical protein